MDHFQGLLSSKKTLILGVYFFVMESFIVVVSAAGVRKCSPSMNDDESRLTLSTTGCPQPFCFRYIFSPSFLVLNTWKITSYSSIAGVAGAAAATWEELSAAGGAGTGVASTGAGFWALSALVISGLFLLTEYHTITAVATDATGIAIHSQRSLEGISRVYPSYSYSSVAAVVAVVAGGLTPSPEDVAGETGGADEVEDEEEEEEDDGEAVR